MPLDKSLLFCLCNSCFVMVTNLLVLAVCHVHSDTPKGIVGACSRKKSLSSLVFLVLLVLIHPSWIFIRVHCLAEAPKISGFQARATNGRHGEFRARCCNQSLHVCMKGIIDLRYWSWGPEWLVSNETVFSQWGLQASLLCSIFFSSTVILNRTSSCKARKVQLLKAQSVGVTSSYKCQRNHQLEKNRPMIGFWNSVQISWTFFNCKQELEWGMI